MKKNQSLYDVLTHKNEDKDLNLAQKLVRNYAMLALSGFSYLGIALFTARTGIDVYRAVNDDEAQSPTPKK